MLLDFFFDRQPFAEYSAGILNLCAEKEIVGYTTPLIIANVYYLLRKTAKHNIIVEKIKQLLNIIDIVKMDKNTVLEAINSDFKDFEDSLQNFSAIEHGSKQQKWLKLVLLKRDICIWVLKRNENSRNIKYNDTQTLGNANWQLEILSRVE